MKSNNGHKPRILITVAARGGSKQVKNKNIRLLMGQPLIRHTIRQALSWKKADAVVVTTDSRKIADIAKKAGAQVPFMRPKHLATDKSAKVPVIQHACRQCEKFFNKRFDVVVDLDPTSPIRTIKDLDNCLTLFLKHKPSTIFSVVEAHKNPYFNMVEEGNDRRVKICKTLRKKVVRRQDAPKVYDANASIYFYDRDYLLNSRDPKVINNRCLTYEMSPESGFDIDREVDFKFIEFLVKEKIVSL